MTSLVPLENLLTLQLAGETLAFNLEFDIIVWRLYPGRQATRLLETDVSYLAAEELQCEAIWRANLGETGGGCQPFSRWGKPLSCHGDC